MIRDQLTTNQQSQLQRFEDLLLTWTKTINLIGPDARQNLRPHVDEALAAAEFLRPTGRVIDVGSGGGLPAIPMAIAFPDAEFHLVEGDQRKWAFLKQAIRECALNSKAHGDRLQRFVTRLDSQFRCDLVTSRAVGRPDEWVPVLEPWLAPDGRVALFEGSDQPPAIPGFGVQQVIPLPRGTANFLFILKRSTEMSHG
jgi:16S rRNA (guanine527-N7)-methyltransferase